MSDQWTVSEMRNILKPAIDEAYRQTAPKQPTLSCYVVVPIPAPVFDSEALAEEFGRVLSKEMPAIRRVEYMAPGRSIILDDGSEFSSPSGIIVYFYPWVDTAGAA